MEKGIDVLSVLDELLWYANAEQNDHEALRIRRAYAAVADLIEAAESIADHYDMDGYGATAWKSLALEMADKARTALARVKGD